MILYISSEFVIPPDMLLLFDRIIRVEHWLEGNYVVWDKDANNKEAREWQE